MLNTLISSQQSTHLSPAPLSLSFNTNEEYSIDSLSTLFLTLVYFLKEDNELDDASTKGACEFLNKIDSKCPFPLTPEQLLHRLVPTADGTCSRFAEHLVVILTYGNVDLADCMLRLIKTIILRASFDNLVEFVMTETQEPEAGVTVVRIVLESHHLRLIATSRTQPHPPSQTSKLIFDFAVQPLEQFWEFIFMNRLSITNTHPSVASFSLLSTLISHAPFDEQLTDFVLSSSISLAGTSCLAFIELNDGKYDFLSTLADAVLIWHQTMSQERRRAKAILARLEEEGLFEACELFIQSDFVHPGKYEDVRPAARLTFFLGGNQPFLSADERAWLANSWENRCQECNQSIVYVPTLRCSTFGGISPPDTLDHRQTYRTTTRYNGLRQTHWTHAQA
ncbi:hypothetical protein BLNAU_21087 [Blattamonas nauphoetae]|uniref:Uncharacterized protein n=1 Tax=Blattamonas nauphoetae TaxID=2049346 RepID=A0ABQ9WXG2_9EUKA|nr:hypothetical protein BLNAU_21087 [Blattamonas nauphoetae]